MPPKDLLLNHLRVILGSHVEADIVDYIHSMKCKEDLDEFMETILDRNNSGHIISYEGICKILFGSKNVSKVNQHQSKNPIKNRELINKSNKLQKGKKKFSDINSFQEKKKQVDGRKSCDCEGQEHEFMNNCLNCGRIHCFEEGPGPCFFCNEPVTLMGEESYIQTTSQKDNKSGSGKHKQNKVFDDDNDYFKSNEIPNQSKDDKRRMVIALDFASRKVIESTTEDVRIKEKLHEDIKKHLTNVEKLYRKLQKQSEMTTILENNDLVDLLIQMRHKKPAGNEDLGTEDSTTHYIDYGRVYDEDLITNTDHGLCLSMHQPYASLLVAGVKKHEGRSWKTNHRGRLWIAAAAKIPDEDEISALEIFYRQYYDDQSLKFPRDYPVSCLLGCVFVEDCLDQETYRKRFPNGESDSPFVLICSNPIILPIFYPIIGKHKIYPLDKELHNCAKLSLTHASYGME